MKRRISLLLAGWFSLAGAFGVALPGSDLTGVVSGAGTFAGKNLQQNDRVTIFLGFDDNLKLGMPIVPSIATPYLSQSSTGRPFAFDGAWDTLVAQIKGAWYAYTRDSDGQTLDQKMLTDFVPADVLTLNAGKLRIPYLQTVRMNADLTLVTVQAHFNGNAAVIKQTTLDIRDANNQDVYFLSSDLSRGARAHFRLSYTFETDSVALQQFLSQHPNVSNDTLRTSIVYWVMGLQSPDHINPALLNQDLVTMLNAPPANQIQDVAQLRLNVLSLLRGQLNLAIDATGARQTWGFPSFRIYQRTPATTEYSDAFFLILDQKQFGVRTGDTFGSTVPGQGLADAALDFLKGSHYPSSFFFNLFDGDANSDLVNLYNSIQKPGAAASYDPNALPASLSLDSASLLSASLALNAQSSTVKLSIPRQSGGDLNAFSNPLLFFPPGPNIVSAATVSNDTLLEQYLQPLAQLPGSQPKTIEIDFNNTQSVRSLVFWLAQNTQLTAAAYSGTQLLAAPSSVAFATAVPAVGASSGTSGTSWSLVSQGQLTTAAGLGIASWNVPVMADRIVITVSSGAVYNLRAYDKLATIDTSNVYTLSPDGTSISDKYTSVRQPPELFSTAGRNDYSFFTELAGASLPRSSINRQASFQPVSYLPGGLETPLSFDLKVLNNQFWQQKLGGSQGFSVTEFDLNRKGTVGSDWTYGPAFLPLSVSGFSDAGSYMYPYAYGIDVPKADGMVVNANSPLYEEKLAGVDSLGMVWSLMQILGWPSRSDPSLSDRFKARTTLASLDQITGTAAAPPWKSYGANPQYRLDENWLRDNSVVITDLNQVASGDLLVGYEGGELTVAIVEQNTHDADPLRAIVVLTINRATKRAIYTRWGDMSTNPLGYHVRRLFTIPAASPPTSTSGFLWLDPAFPQGVAVNLTYQIDRSDDPDNFKNWVPNTGELRYLGPIQLTGRDKSDLTEVMDNASWSVYQALNFSGPAAGGQPAGFLQPLNANTTFHLIALQQPFAEDGVSILPVSSALPSRTPRNVEYVDLYDFQSSGNGTNVLVSTLNPHWDPKVWSMTVQNGKLQVVGPDKGKPYNKFAIIATSTASGPVPGDDIQLSFQVTTKVGTLVGATNEAPRLAVYDKKMLWRANLYIDEGGGSNDWNNRHPWVDNNGWNVSDGTKPGSPNGGQRTSIKPWTLWRNNSVVSSAVAYGWGGMEPVSSFNDDLTAQANLIANARTPGNPSYLGAAYSALPWPQDRPTVAPGGNWFNYIFPSRKTLPSNNGYIYGQFDANVTQHKYRIDQLGNIVPGLSTFLDANSSVPFNLLDQDQVNLASFPNDPNKQSGSYSYTSGVDCSGFVSSAASYPGSEYSLSGQGHVTTDQLSRYGLILQPGINDDSNIIIPNLKYAVPGDVLNSPATNGAGHCVIIQNLVSGPSRFPAYRGDTLVIQAGPGHLRDMYRVIAPLSWDKDSGMGKNDFQNYVILRLALLQ